MCSALTRVPFAVDWKQGQRAFGFPAPGANVSLLLTSSSNGPILLLRARSVADLALPFTVTVRLLPTQCACCRCSRTLNCMGRAEEEATVAQEEAQEEAATEAEQTEAGEAEAA
jgi:hypothetical protein